MSAVVEPLEFGTVLPERFWAKVVLSGDCWRWRGARDRKGYGRVGVGRRGEGTTGAHVWMCRAAHGEKPSPKHVVRHSCDNPWCVNPQHLSWGTAKDNSTDMVERGRSTKVTHCKHGHLSENNRYKSGACKTCQKDRAAAQRERNREQ